MAYIGKSPSGTGVRSRFFYTQSTAGATSISGNDDDNRTLTFSDAEYVDVYLNGSLLAKGDYTAASNTISGLAALASGDIVEVVVYDIFSVADTVSAKDGGTFSGNVGMQGLTATTGDFSSNLSTTGTLGVGTQSPQKTVEIFNGADQQIRLRNGAVATQSYDIGRIGATGLLRFYGNQSGYNGYIFDGADGVRMQIHSNGVVTTPKTPAFHVRVSANSASYQVPHPTQHVWENQGSHWSSSQHRFTAPVGGMYFFVASGYTNYTSGHGYLGIFKNGTQQHHGFHWNYSSTMHGGFGMTAMLTLQANDYVHIGRPSAGASSVFAILNFSGHLIG